VTRAAAVLAVASLAVTWAGEARAQVREEFPRARALDVNVGGIWLGPVGFGQADATLTRNQEPTAGYTLFSTSSRLGPALGAEARIGYHVTRTVAIEAAVLFARPALDTEVSGDAEGAPNVTARETLTQVLIDVSGVVHLAALRFRRAVPFVLGGAGYLRELHDGGALAETGHTYHLGGGLTMPFVLRRGVVRSLALRLDGRLYLRSQGADLDEEAPTRITGGAGASLVVGF
jgi:hypothetical protein